MSEQPPKRTYTDEQYAEAEAKGDSIMLLQMLLDEAGLTPKLNGIPVRLAETPEPKED
jgi:hypothetical protein